jgi:TRAP-type C4-dicarboxylate transport system permease small subunit
MHSHVRVKAVIELIPYRLRTIINLFVNLITLGFLLMVIKYSIVQGIALWERGYSTMLLKIPLFPFSFVLALGFVIFSFVIFVDIIDILANIFDFEHTD